MKSAGRLLKYSVHQVKCMVYLLKCTLILMFIELFNRYSILNALNLESEFWFFEFGFRNLWNLRFTKQPRLVAPRHVAPLRVSLLPVDPSPCNKILHQSLFLPRFLNFLCRVKQSKAYQQ